MFFQPLSAENAGTFFQPEVEFTYKIPALTDSETTINLINNSAEKQTDDEKR